MLGVMGCWYNPFWGFGITKEVLNSNPVVCKLNHLVVLLPMSFELGGCKQLVRVGL